MSPPKVQSILEPPDFWKGSIEGVYLQDFFEAFARNCPDLFSSLEFEILHLNTIHHRVPELRGGKRKVLIWLSDEGSYIPLGESSRYLAVFKSYWLKEGPIRNIHPFPLCGSGEVHSAKIKPMEERCLSVFFSGNFCPNRADFFRALTAFRYLPPFALRAYPLRRIYWELLRSAVKKREFSGLFPGGSVAFTSGFRKGLAPAEFASRLADTRIALCPEGFRSKETIRMFEAMRLGCVIIGPRMPPNPFYKNSPVIQKDSWLGIRGLVAELLASPHRLAQIHKETLHWWDAVCSAKAMAEKTISFLAACEGKGSF